MGAWLRRIRGRGPHGGCCVKHTPGPWEVGSTIESGTQAIIHDGDSVLAILTTIPPNPANARLIAAAPDLLDALNEMTRLALRPTGGCSAAEKRNAIEASIAAIAKATGEGE